MSYSVYDRWLDDPMHEQEKEDAASEAREAWANQQAESLASWPLLQPEAEVVSDHFSDIEWNEKQAVQFELLVTKLVLGQPVNASDCSEFLTLEKMREIIAESIIAKGDRYLIGDN